MYKTLGLAHSSKSFLISHENSPFCTKSFLYLVLELGCSFYRYNAFVPWQSRMLSKEIGFIGRETWNWNESFLVIFSYKQISDIKTCTPLEQARCDSTGRVSTIRKMGVAWFWNASHWSSRFVMRLGICFWEFGTTHGNMNGLFALSD